MQGNRKALIKTLSVIMMMCVLLTLLAACGGEKYSNSKYLGKWEATNAEYSGVEMDPATILGGEFSFELKETGKCNVVIGEDKSSGEWKKTDKGFNVEDEFKFEVDGKKATLKYQGINITFEQKAK